MDLGAECEWPDEIALAVTREALAELPCPTLALAEGLLAPAAEALVAEFDLVIASRSDLEHVAGEIRAHPLASQALAQLLRLSDGRSVHEGLIAESLVYATLQSGPEFAAWLAARPEPRAPEDAGRPPIHVGRVGSRFEISLDRPARRNAFSSGMRDALCEALRVAAVDPSIERVVLRGEGPDFCSGGDLDEFGSTPDPSTAHAIRSTRHPARWLHVLAARVEAQLHGACIGAGIELPAFAGHLRANADARIRLPELSMGLVPGAGGTVSLPRRIGRQRAAWLAFSGRSIDAESALEWRLIDEIIRD